MRSILPLILLLAIAPVFGRAQEYDVRNLHGPEEHQLVMAAVEADIDALEAAASVTTLRLAPAAVTGAKLDPDALTPVIVTGADSSGGAASLTAATVVATQRVAAAINLTDSAVLTKAHFTPAAGAVTQAVAAGNLATKKILLFLLPAGS
jgi:hypothetical protein